MTSPFTSSKHCSTLIHWSYLNLVFINFNTIILVIRAQCHEHMCFMCTSANLCSSLVNNLYVMWLISDWQKGYALLARQLHKEMRRPTHNDVSPSQSRGKTRHCATVLRHVITTINKAQNLSYTWTTIFFRVCAVLCSRKSQFMPITLDLRIEGFILAHWKFFS